MHIACSTLCFASMPFEKALRLIANLEFAHVEIALIEEGGQLKPSDILQDPLAALRLMKTGPNLTASALYARINAPDQNEYDLQLAAIAKLAKNLTVTVITIPPSPASFSLEVEAARLKRLCEIAGEEGVTLSIENEVGTLAQDPATAVKLCQMVPDLALTLDPGHYVNGPHQNGDFSAVYPYVAHVQLCDSGTGPNQAQVPVGQGLIEYNRIITQLSRHGYERALSIEIAEGLNMHMDIEAEVRKLKLLLETWV